MEIGMSSATFYPNVMTENSIRIMKNLGFNLGEIFLNCPSEYESDFIARLNEERYKYDFDIVSIHSFSSAFEPYIFDSYKRRTKDMLKTFKKVCMAGNLLHAKFYTFHGMKLQSLEQLDFKHIIDIYDALVYTASEFNIKLCQENVSWCMSADPKFISILNERCSNAPFYTLDIKQAYKACICIEDYISVMGNRLVNLHLNDRSSKEVCLLPGRGNIDFTTIKTKLENIDYQGVGIIEVYSDNYKNYDEIRKSGETLKKVFIN